MTPTELKQAADEMVANWMILLVQSLPFISYASIDNPTVAATHCAIAHCKLVIEELEELDSNMKKFRIVAKKFKNTASSSPNWRGGLNKNNVWKRQRYSK